MFARLRRIVGQTLLNFHRRNWAGENARCVARSKQQPKTKPRFFRLQHNEQFKLQAAKVSNQLGYIRRMMGETRTGKFSQNAISYLTTLNRTEGETDLLKALELACSYYYWGHQFRPGSDPTSQLKALQLEANPLIE